MFYISSYSFPKQAIARVATRILAKRECFTIETFPASQGHNKLILQAGKKIIR